MEIQNKHYQEQEQSPEQKTTVTLLVKHLPEAIPFELLVRLFSHYDARAVRPCVAGRLKNCAFVDFKDEIAASRAESQLNRLRFLGKVLSVERAKSPSTVENKEPNKIESGKVSCTIPGYAAEKDPTVEKVTKNGNQSSVFIQEPIAPKLGIEYPFPPHLEYAYPPPNGDILTNIVNALIAVPQFYTQVLHLMNKMNLPAPFCQALPTPPLPPPPVPSMPAPPKHEACDLSSDESELESSDEEELDKGKSSTGLKNVPRPEKKKLKLSQKRGRPDENMNNASQETVKPAALLPKEVPTVKKKAPVLQIKITPKGQPSESMQISKEDGQTEAENNKHSESNLTKQCATIEEIAASKMPLSEILSIPMFKNYTPGNPAPVLYIKNLAKDVTVDDLYYVFGALFKDLSEAKSALGVRLMQEGRMKGQAFVSFPSVELSGHALKVAHGFLLKGKPMIIQFGRNPSESKVS